MAKSSDDKLEKLQPWYKFPMAWLVFALPFIAVVASITTVVIAVKNAPTVLEHNKSYKSILNSKNNDKSKD